MKTSSPIKEILIEVLPLILFLVLVIPTVLGIWVIRSSMEASTYNRITGSDVTTWDAMWVELRVQDAPAKKAAK